MIEGLEQVTLGAASPIGTSHITRAKKTMVPWLILRMQPTGQEHTQYEYEWRVPICVKLQRR